MTHNHQPLPIKTRLQSIELLNHILASSIDLHSQFKTALWNVQASGNIDIRYPFESAAKTVSEASNIIAERISALDGTVLSTIQWAVKSTLLIPYELGIANGKEHGFALCSSLSAFSQSLTIAINNCSKNHDFTSMHILTNILTDIDKSLRSLVLKIDANFPDNNDGFALNSIEHNKTKNGHSLLEKVI